MTTLKMCMISMASIDDIIDELNDLHVHTVSSNEQALSLPFRVPDDMREYKIHEMSDTNISIDYAWFSVPLYKYMNEASDVLSIEDLLNTKIGYWSVGFNPSRRQILEVTGYIGGDKCNVNYRDVDADVSSVVSKCRSLCRLRVSDGYRTDVEISFNEKWLAPMLSRPYAASSVVCWPVSVQTKVDGVRCMISRVEGKIMAFTRKHHPIMYVEHITAEIEHLINSLPDRSVIDGELYIPGMSRVDIKAQVAAKSNDNKSVFKRPEHAHRLQYYMFDVRLPDTLSTDQLVMEARYERLINTYNACADDGVQFKNSFILHNFICHSDEEVESVYRMHVDQGHEGVMVKQMANGNFSKSSKQYIRSLYKGGSHCINIMKKKRYYDCEVVIHEVRNASKGAERSKGCAMFVTYDFDPEGKREALIRPSAPVEMQKFWYENPHTVLGRVITVQYTELDRHSGMPQHCTMIDFRDDGN